MAYTVLARKYRSRTFDEVVGQEPIARTLVNSIKAGRVHHGYLFTGTRGVGKTSMARILAKALNCLKADGPTPKPCLECDACGSIAEGQDIDVIEIDAASNTGVDNIRELRSNAAFRPARSRFKIYIIDEVHMLSTGAFNALLKTLEEPPEHVKFILATTEIQKVPATIQSRCQRFTFRNIGPDEIATQIEKISAEEGAKAEPAVVRRVARLAKGSMRDALSILDQLLSLSPKKLSADLLDDVLPPAQDELIFRLLGHAADGDAAAVLADTDAALAQGRSLETFCNDMIEVVRALMLTRTVGADTDLADIPAAARDEYTQLAKRFELSHDVQMIAMLEELRRNVHFSGAGRALTDALMVRIAKMTQWASIEQLLGQANGPAGSGSAQRIADQRSVMSGRAAASADAPSPTAAPRSSLGAADEKKNVRPPVEAHPAAEAVASPPLARPAPPVDAPPHARPEAASASSSRRPTATAAVRSSEPSEGGPDADVSRYDEGVVRPDHGGVSYSDVPAGSYDPHDEFSSTLPAVPVRSRVGADAEAVARVLVSVSAAEAARIKRDPVVRQVLELFEGAVCNIEIEPRGQDSVPADESAEEAEADAP